MEMKSITPPNKAFWFRPGWININLKRSLRQAQGTLQITFPSKTISKSPNEDYF